MCALRDLIFKDLIIIDDERNLVNHFDKDYHLVLSIRYLADLAKSGTAVQTPSVSTVRLLLPGKHSGILKKLIESF